jgi:hypothetical protein
VRPIEVPPYLWVMDADDHGPLGLMHVDIARHLLERGAVDFGATKFCPRPGHWWGMDILRVTMRVEVFAEQRGTDVDRWYVLMTDEPVEVLKHIQWFR